MPIGLAAAKPILYTDVHKALTEAFLTKGPEAASPSAGVKGTNVNGTANIASLAAALTDAIHKYTLSALVNPQGILTTVPPSSILFVGGVVGFGGGVPGPVGGVAAGTNIAPTIAVHTLFGSLQ